MEKYKEAERQVNQSGGGLEDDEEEYKSFYDHIHTNVCKWYDQLHEVLKDRPTTFAAYTNEIEVIVNNSEKNCNEETVNKNVDIITKKNTAFVTMKRINLKSNFHMNRTFLQCE